MALRHAILSAMSRGVPLNGYTLTTVLADDTERAWHASPSQVYSELSRLEKSGLIEAHERNKRGHATYVITDAGLDEIRHWLTLVEPDHTVRNDAQLRMMTVWTLDPVEARHVIEAELVYQRKRQYVLRERIREYPLTREDTPVWRHRRAAYDLWLASANLYIGWLERLLELSGAPGVDVAELLGEEALMAGGTTWPSLEQTD